MPAHTFSARLEALEDRLAPARLLSLLSAADVGSGLGVSARVSLLETTPLAISAEVVLRVAPVELGVNVRTSLFEGDLDLDVDVQTPAGDYLGVSIGDGGEVTPPPVALPEEPLPPEPNPPSAPAAPESPSLPLLPLGGQTGQTATAATAGSIPLHVLVANPSFLANAPQRLPFAPASTAPQDEEPATDADARDSPGQPEIATYLEGGSDSIEEDFERLPPPQTEPREGDVPRDAAVPLELAGATPEAGIGGPFDPNGAETDDEKEAAPLTLVGLSGEGGLPSWLVFVVVVSSLAVARLAAPGRLRRADDDSSLLAGDSIS